MLQRACCGGLQLTSQRPPLFSALHELAAIVEVIEPVVLPELLELEILEELCELTELVPLVDVFDSIELVTLLELLESTELVVPGDWAAKPDALSATARIVAIYLMRRCSDRDAGYEFVLTTHNIAGSPRLDSENTREPHPSCAIEF